MGLFIYGVNYFFRALRLFKFINANHKVDFITVAKSSGMHGFYNYFLPVRSGDLTLPLLLNVYGSIPLTTGIKLLIKIRLQDFISLGFIICSASLMLQGDKEHASFRNLLLLFGMILTAGPYLAIYFIRNKSSYLPDFLLNKFLQNSPGYPKLLELLLSFFIWLLTGSTLYCVAKALSLPLSFEAVWLIIALQLPLQLLPVQGLANAGNHELGWIGALSLLGISTQSAVNYALSSHIILILYVIILGGVSASLPPYRKHQITKTSSYNSDTAPSERE